MGKLQTAPNWICCQIGAREHYVIPRILCEQKNLRRLYTDIWLNQDQFVHRLVNQCIPRLAGRYDNSLADSKIVSFTNSALLFELSKLLLMNRGWSLMHKRNRWFQLKVISSKIFYHDCKDTNKPIVFCYSYAALDIIRRAKEYGCITVLGQIDAGTVEEDIVMDAVNNCSYLRPSWTRAPGQYWKDWKEECQLADRIIVNSQWSRNALVKAGIIEKKISVVPLMYENKNPGKFTKNYPGKFTRERPLKVLFLGSLIIRKGIAEILSATQSMKNEPVEFWFVGEKGVSLTDEMIENKNIKWIGPVPRSETQKYYQMCDVFILPTLSDGFGLTQLEAMSYSLPVIASRNCGDVVQDGVNGILLPEVTSEIIVRVLTDCLDDPEKLQHMSGSAWLRVKDFSSAKVFPLLVDSIEGN